MSDARSSMAASTASSTVVTKELLNAGFGEGLDYLAAISIPQKAGVFAVNPGHTISASFGNKENIPRQYAPASPSGDDEDTGSATILAATQAQPDEDRRKVSEAKTALKNAWWREKRAQAAKLDLKEQLDQTAS
ncbi:hypothetical protein B0H14DRAFT_3527925 [Mycena olivaceomarginata]|nr:hypothetical protein B0H14DRAFT_3527925 [Mycena olivaceomarginata]